MAFMEQDIQHGTWVIVDGPMGGECLPQDLVGAVKPYNGPKKAIPAALVDYCENREVYSIELKVGYGARMSAPGYMDCTNWTVFDTEEEARAYLDETYGDEDENDDEEED